MKIGKKLKQPLILISSDEEDNNGSHLIEEVKRNYPYYLCFKCVNYLKYV